MWTDLGPPATAPPRSGCVGGKSNNRIQGFNRAIFSSLGLGTLLGVSTGWTPYGIELSREGYKDHLKPPIGWSTIAPLILTPIGPFLHYIPEGSMALGSKTQHAQSVLLASVSKALFASSALIFFIAPCRGDFSVGNGIQLSYCLRAFLEHSAH